MTQNGPYPGQPSQPWPAGRPEQPYREPADPWGDQPDDGHHGGEPGSGWGGNPVSIPPGAAGTSTGPDPGGPPEPGYGPAAAYSPGPVGSPPAWPPPVTSPPRRGPGMPIIVLVAVLGLLICGGLGTTAWLLTNRDQPGVAATDPTLAPATPQSPAAGDATPTPRSSNDARFVTKGQCVRNDGTAAKPEMTITDCAAGTYQVLARVNGATTGESDAETKCAKYQDYTKWYFYDSELDDLDFVLCLRER
jgi:hypothetical protein